VVFLPLKIVDMYSVTQTADFVNFRQMLRGVRGSGDHQAAANRSKKISANDLTFFPEYGILIM